MWVKLSGRLPDVQFAVALAAVLALVLVPAAPAATNVVPNRDCETGSCGSTPIICDVNVESELLAVTISSFKAVKSHRGVLVRWRTGTEADMLGFHLYRERAGRRVRVDKRLIPANGSISGARYSFLDRRAPHGKLRYRLQAVGIDGSREWFGPVGVGR
jgi:hypothetical protein